MTVDGTQLFPGASRRLTGYEQAGCGVLTGVADDVNPNARPRLDAADLAMLRVRRFTEHRIRPAVHGERVAVDVEAWTVGGEPVPFAHAVQQVFRPFAVGETWGRPWDTVWFRVTGEVPAGWMGLRVPLSAGLGAMTILAGLLVA